MFPTINGLSNLESQFDVEGTSERELSKILRWASEKPMFLAEQVFCNIFKRYLEIAESEENKKHAVIHFHQAYQQQKQLKPYHDLFTIIDLCPEYLMDVLQKYKEDKGIKELVLSLENLIHQCEKGKSFLVDVLNYCFESHSEIG